MLTPNIISRIIPVVKLDSLFSGTVTAGNDPYERFESIDHLAIRVKSLNS
ncbi:MAG: hypothetical protein WC959_10245 [Kiritimatiellales bacterium]